MNDQRGKFSVATLGLIGLLLSGCAGNGLQLPGMAFGNAGGTGVEFERTPYVLPSVVAVSTPENPNVSKFLMNLSVKNYMEKDSGKIWVKAYSEYFTSQGKEQLCKQTEWIPVGPLPPGKSWTRAAYPVDKFSECKCLRPECSGTLWISLHAKQGATQRVPGTNTALLVRWSPDGKLQNMTVDSF